MPHYDDLDVILVHTKQNIIRQGLEIDSSLFFSVVPALQGICRRESDGIENLRHESVGDFIRRMLQIILYRTIEIVSYAWMVNDIIGHETAKLWFRPICADNVQ